MSWSFGTLFEITLYINSKLAWLFTEDICFKVFNLFTKFRDQILNNLIKIKMYHLINALIFAITQNRFVENNGLILNESSGGGGGRISRQWILSLFHRLKFFRNRFAKFVHLIKWLGKNDWLAGFGSNRIKFLWKW